MEEHSGWKAAELIGYYRKLHTHGSGDSDQLPYRLTVSGAWAVSRPAHLFYFFRKIELSRFRLFVDLGSGDGIVACLAALFTTAVGIEADSRLVRTARGAARALDLERRVGFIRADYLSQGLQAADCLYIYPDKPVFALERELSGWSGTLLIYGPHFPPKELKLRDKLRCGRETLAVYSF